MNIKYINKANISFSPWSLLSKFNKFFSGTPEGVIFCKLLLKHIWILFGVLSLVWTFNQIPSNGMCGGPPSASRISKNLNGVPTPVWTSYQKSPPSSQTSYQSSSTCISECCNPKWACSQMFSSRFNTSVLFFSPAHHTSCAGVIGAQYYF